MISLMRAVSAFRISNKPNCAHRRLDIEFRQMSIPLRKAHAAAGDSTMPVRFNISQPGLASACAVDDARCVRNWILLGNIAAWILIALAARALLF